MGSLACFLNSTKNSHFSRGKKKSSKRLKVKATPLRIFDTFYDHPGKILVY